jgi:hypothetical protein
MVQQILVDENAPECVAAPGAGRQASGADTACQLFSMGRD